MRQYLVLAYFYASLFSFLLVLAYLSLQRFFPSSPTQISLKLAFGRKRADEKKNKERNEEQNDIETKNKINSVIKENKRIVYDLVMNARLTKDPLVKNNRHHPKGELFFKHSAVGSSSLNRVNGSLNAKPSNVSREPRFINSSESRYIPTEAEFQTDADSAICNRKLDPTSALKLKQKARKSESRCCADNIVDLRWETRRLYCNMAWH